MERKTIEEVVVGMECSVGGVGWSERGFVTTVTKDTITMEDFDVDRAGIKWVFAH
jgi:hypothetical protein|tara:strand:+ start:1450 stop:1614 length:165 start_codon:yes stop_codon:yes gene_type:complete